MKVEEGDWYKLKYKKKMVMMKCSKVMNDDREFFYKLHFNTSNVYLPEGIIRVYKSWPDLGGFGGLDIAVVEDLTGNLAKAGLKSKDYACLPETDYESDKARNGDHHHHNYTLGGWGLTVRGRHW